MLIVKVFLQKLEKLNKHLKNSSFNKNFFELLLFIKYKNKLLLI